MVIAVAPIVFMVVGGLLWGFTQGKAADMGRILFAIGAFWFCSGLSHSTLKVG